MRGGATSIRRSEIGAEKRTRTTNILLNAARELFGREDGRLTRIEDICAVAQVSRGTFYNYFPGMESLVSALANHVSERFDDAVHDAFEALPTSAEQTCVAIRCYLRRASKDAQWGWAMVNTSLGKPMHGEMIFRRVRATIQSGIDSGEFTLDSADVGRDLVLGSGLAAMLTLLQGRASADYAEAMTCRILLALGVRPDLAAELVKRPLATLTLSQAELAV